MSDKKKILYLITKSNWGGAQKYVFDMAVYSKNKGFNVLMASGGTGKKGSSGGRLWGSISQAGIKTHFLKNLERDINIFSDISAFFEILSLIKKERPDILHLNSAKVSLPGAVAGRILGVRKIIFTVHGWPYKEDINILSKLFRWILSWVTAMTSTDIIAVSNDDFIRGQKMPGISKKIFLIRNGIEEIDFIERNQAKEDVLKKIKFPVDKNTLWIVDNAELHKNKGLDTLIMAFSKIKMDSLLFLISDGEERKNLERLVKNLRLEKKVIFLGFIPDAKKYLHAFDIFALPSRKEGLPYTLLEAGMASLPVVSTRVGGIPEVVTHEKSGLLVDSGDINNLNLSLTKLIKDSSLRSTLGRGLQEKVRTDYSMNKMLSETIKLYA